ncbi:monovalent cation/H+ antiporter complex subunit F [Fusibacter sp. 3D3]|uniref:monovalent cation/H+ antiporter complex subunit F n=1 Tax=Fusibacter sp. 3D3 TaxID=1048380 RepID=UPI00085335B6|nr:monovalent cation/H+ antiporter complex subunit F [Fusibacter sp. 3D3]GAU77935.1 Na(+) H(+) antiporter subunit F [Fusibacter sp. 3D3]
MLTIIILLILLLTLSLLRILLGPSLWDRLLGLNMVASKLLALIVLYASYKGISMYLDLAIVYALLGFVGIIFLSIYVQRKGRF